MKTTYPLHIAVREQDAEVVRMLLCIGADPLKADSAGLTAEQLARKLNKVGSHDGVLATLDSYRPSTSGCSTLDSNWLSTGERSQH